MPHQVTAQTAADTLHLGTLQDAAVARDPRARELSLDSTRTRLALADIDAERLPAVGATGQGQYQSDVTHIGIVLPGGMMIPGPPHATYDAYLGVEEPLFDPSRAPRRAVQRAQLGQSQSQVRATLYGLRQQVNDAFFDAALLQAQEAEIDAAIADLQTQLAVASSRVRAGTALPGDSAGILAEVLRRRQDRAQLEADRVASLQVLADLTGWSVASSDVLALPDLAPQVTSARSAGDTLQARPEYAQFAATRTLLGRQAQQIASTTLPRVSAFARAGYGKPGLNMLNDEFERYWLAGVQVQWNPWTWGTNGRDRESLTLEQQIVGSEEAAFRAGIRRSSARAVARIDFLAQALASDRDIVSLREETAQETRLRFDEGVITAAQYIDRETDLLNARLGLATHRVELAQARANYLTTLGLEVR